MKRFFKWPFVAIPTFAVGLAAAGVFWFDTTWPISSVEPVPPVETSTCLDSSSFPGKAREITSLRKGKSGYFPKDAFSGSWEELDGFINDWYGKHLKAMAEGPLLDEVRGEVEVYRFLWLRTFHHPIYVRVEKRLSDIWLVTRELDGAGGYEPGKVIRDRRFRVDQRQWCEFRNRLESAAYWGMPTQDPDSGGNDGAEWILEAVRDGRYHVVERWTPRGGEYYEACIYLLRLSGIDVDKVELY